MMKEVNFQFENANNKDGIISSLAKYGIAIIHNYVDSSRLEKLREESMDLLGVKTKDRLEIDESAMQRMALSNFNAKKYPTMASLTNDEIFEHVTKDFFHPYSHQLENIYIHRDVNKMAFNSVWHIDPMITVKFYVYLNDVDKTNGAFKYNLGSHREGYYRLMYKRHTGDTHPTFGIPEDEILNAIDVEAKAGSMLIFNPMGTHSAGKIEKGKERSVIRYHYTTVPTKSKFKRLTYKLWRTKFNPVRYQGSRDEYFNIKHKSQDYHVEE
jgi:hypothetical protein